VSAADGVMSTRRRAGAVLGVCLLGFLAGQVLAAVLIGLGAALAHYPGGLSALARSSTPPWWANALSLVGLWAGFGVAVAYASGPRGIGALPGAWRVRPSDGLYVLLGAACQLAVALIYAPFHVRGFGRPVHHLFGAASGASLALLGVMTSLCAPVLEEWFFRGVVFRALEAGAGGPGAVATFVAAVTSAALFALAHAEALQFAGLALLGVVLAYLVARTRRLVPSVITHASFNSVAFAALLVQRAR
jgi:CAAX protease family protein